MRPDVVHQKIPYGEHARLQRQLPVARLLDRETARLQDPDDDEGECDRDHEHHRVPRHGVLHRVLAEDALRRRPEVAEELRPERVRVLHLQTVERLADVVVD